MRDKIAVIAAHPDDEVIGCGGTLVKHIKEEGAQVNILFMSDGESSRFNEINDECKNLIVKREKFALQVADFIGINSVKFLRLKDNQLDLYSKLKITKDIETFLDLHKPNIIYTHFGGDLNIDHQITFEAVMTAARPTAKSFIKNIYSFEIQSSTELGLKENKFHPNMYVNVSNSIDIKKSLLDIYKSELRDYPSSRSIESIIGKNMQRGSEAGIEYAEAFIVNRSIKE